jgi:hypothetical protein
MSSSSSTRPLVGASLSRNVFEGIYDSVSKTAVLAASSNGHGKAFRQRILPRSMIPRNATPAGLRWHLHAFTGARDDVASSAIAFVYVLHRADTCGRPSSSREGYVPDESGPLKSNLTSSSPLFVWKWTTELCTNGKSRGAALGPRRVDGEQHLSSRSSCTSRADEM